MDPDLLNEAMRLFEEYEAGNIQHYVEIEPLDGVTLNVAVVAVQRGGEIGFISTLGFLGVTFYVEGKGYRILKFNDRHLIVYMADWYADDHVV